MNTLMRLVIEWLLALGNSLFKHSVAATAGFIRWVTFWRIVYMVAFIVAMLAFAQAFTLDVTLLFAGDVALYMEVVSAVMFFAAKGYVYQVASITGPYVRRAVSDLSARARRYGGRLRQRRNANALRRRSGGRGSPQTPDEDAGLWAADSCAFA